MSQQISQLYRTNVLPLADGHVDAVTSRSDKRPITRMFSDAL
jgi:hypothetical protein